MKVHKISSQSNFKEIFSSLGVDKIGSSIMQEKTQILFFYIKDLKTPGANILKQEALSVGADLAVPKGVIVCEKQKVDALLFANLSQLKKLRKKLKHQDFGLKDLASELKRHENPKPFATQIMGVVNANEDSFYHKSRVNSKTAIAKIEEQISHGADIIDLGGVSSRPGSLGVSSKEELKRLKDIIDDIYRLKLYENAVFSLDSYDPVTLKYALDHGFSFINDITALNNDEVAKLAAKYDAQVCLMHMQNDPLTMQKDPHYDDLFAEIDEFFSQRIQKAKSYGISKIILDVGIGFGKNLEHNLKLIKHQAHFRHFGYPLLVGASRKSMIDKITPSSVDDRLLGSVLLHLKALKEGANIIRVHDVKAHFEAIKIAKALDELR